MRIGRLELKAVQRLNKNQLLAITLTVFRFLQSYMKRVVEVKARN